jgi:hypothetical protein
MRYETETIILGILLLLGSSFLAIALITYLYLFLVDKKKANKLPRVLGYSGLMAIAWLLSTVIGIWFTSSSGPIYFIVLSYALIFGASALLSSKIFELTKRDILIYAGIGAAIFNPGWLVLIGIL